jgi:hypothetical protein
MAFSSSGTYLAACSVRGEGFLHNTETHALQPLMLSSYLEADENLVGFSIQGLTLTCWTSKNTVFQTTLKTQDPVMEYPPPSLNRGPCQAQHSFGPLSEAEIIACRQLPNHNIVVVLSKDTHTEIHIFPEGRLSGHPDRIYTYNETTYEACICPDGSVVLDGTVVTLTPPKSHKPSVLDLPTIR